MFESRILSPIAKVFPDKAPEACKPVFEGLLNETVSFQLAVRNTSATHNDRIFLNVEIKSPIRERIQVRRVKYVPVRVPALGNADDYYLNDKKPGLYPDALMDVPPTGFFVMPNLWESFWFDVRPGSDLPAGDYPITICLIAPENPDNNQEITVNFHLIGAVLPQQTLIHTKWLHTDCLCSYYDIPVFSEEYWRITENFIRCAVEHGINTILTPTHTPPLDTRIGTYRPAVQLVDVFVEDTGYRFNFDKLERWVDMCKKLGAEYYEIPHLFTQWGATSAPQFIGHTKDGVKRIFGWDTPAVGGEYEKFLSCYLPALLDKLNELGVEDKLIMHISDEPNEMQLEGYLAAKNVAAKYLRGHKTMDAISDVKYYESGAIERPIPATNHIKPFLEKDIPGLWAYYCIGQGVDVSNLFVAMPGARTRVLGAQLYKYNIAGFLQWGYNFYYSMRSDYPIDPWTETDCDGFSPAGDAFQVYPGKNGQPIVSMRMMHVLEAHQDMRAMQLLESLAGREAVLGIIDEGIEPITFDRYPHSDDYVLGLRERINREIEKYVNK